MSELTLTSQHGRKMMGYLPGYYATSRVMTSVIDAQGAELDKLGQALDETLAQYFVPTATWGLELWERELGIPVDQEKPVEQRRAVIQSRLRGAGTVTVALVERVAEAYDNGNVNVNVDAANCTVTIKFVSTYGVPPNLSDIQAAIEEILPAHLAVEFAFTFFLYSKLDDFTYAEVAASGKSYDEIYNGGVQ